MAAGHRWSAPAWSSAWSLHCSSTLSRVPGVTCHGRLRSARAMRIADGSGSRRSAIEAASDASAVAGTPPAGAPRSTRTANCPGRRPGRTMACRTSAPSCYTFEGGTSTMSSKRPSNPGTVSPLWMSPNRDFQALIPVVEWQRDSASGVASASRSGSLWRTPDGGRVLRVRLLDCGLQRGWKPDCVSRGVRWSGLPGWHRHRHSTLSGATVAGSHAGTPSGF